MQEFAKHWILLCCFVSITPVMVVEGQDQKTHSFEIGPEVYYFMYEEHKPFVFEGVELWDRILMEEEGMFYGVTCAYTYSGWFPLAGNESADSIGGVTLRGEARFAVGKVDYDGQRLLGN